MAWDGAHQPKTDGYTSLKADADAMQDVLVDLRRRLHREPEVALNLQRTQQRVQGAPVEISIGESLSSVTAVVRGDRRNPTEPATVMSRADLEALPLEEQTNKGVRIDNGAMHAGGMTCTPSR
ncbi:MAG: hypothetical protein EOP90_15815 [Lysobacteraceae bacterium]|nr:MAG: hypothetical protein EOP90_15815 [Xanthomonadaceae bacterium]